MDVATGITLVSMVVAGASALYARYAWSTSRDAMAQQALMSILLEYRSAEMMDAVKTLWEFRRAHPGDSMVTEYAGVQNGDDAGWRDAVPAARLVSYFYAYLAHLVDLKILPKEVFYKSWAKADLEIIPKVLMPLERGLGGDPAVLPTLQRLYDNAPEVQALAKENCWCFLSRRL